MSVCHLKQWRPKDDKVELIYEDDDVLYVKKTDFDRAFGAIVSATKDAVIRDFAIK